MMLYEEEIADVSLVTSAERWSAQRWASIAADALLVSDSEKPAAPSTATALHGSVELRLPSAA